MMPKIAKAIQEPVLFEIFIGVSCWPSNAPRRLVRKADNDVPIIFQGISLIFEPEP